MSGQSWFKVRIGLMIFCFVGTLIVTLGGPDPSAEMLTEWFFVTLSVLILFAIPLIVLGFVGICAVTSKADVKWDAPSHYSKPFSAVNPLFFFHFGAYFMGAGGLAILLSSLWNGLGTALEGIFALLESLMLLWGTRLSMRVFKSRMTP